MLDQRIVFLDLETTGATATHDRITEIGLIAVEEGRVTEQWSTLVNPGMSIPPAIQSLTGITNEMVALAPGFDEVAEDLAHKLSGSILAAHNARFDYGFLKNEFRRAGISYTARVLCTVKLSRRLYPEHRRHNLDTLLERHALTCEARHRALGDARVLWSLMNVWTTELGAARVNEAIGELIRAPSVPAGLPLHAYDDIPEAPGVYLFYGENDVVLYVGKSVNLRSRVMAHFSGDHSNNKDMRIGQQVKRIDWECTAGELGALLLESRLVKRLAPVYNRQLRRAAELYTWHWQPGLGRTPELLSARELRAGDLGYVHGLFRSRAVAVDTLRQLATAHQLCSKLTGLENRRGSCFAYQLKRCRGACVGEEPLETHDLRFATALAALRLHTWPYPGVIGIREQAPDGTREELHVLDRWCYLGTARCESDLETITAPDTQPAFDLDTYKILTRFLERPQTQRMIVPLGSRTADSVPA